MRRPGRHARHKDLREHGKKAIMNVTGIVRGLGQMVLRVRKTDTLFQSNIIDRVVYSV
jgi:hypothetical protein